MKNKSIKKFTKKHLVDYLMLILSGTLYDRNK
jgi:hypothetical protein